MNKRENTALATQLAQRYQDAVKTEHAAKPTRAEYEATIAELRAKLADAESIIAKLNTRLLTTTPT